LEGLRSDLETRKKGVVAVELVGGRIDRVGKEGEGFERWGGLGIELGRGGLG